MRLAKRMWWTVCAVVIVGSLAHLSGLRWNWTVSAPRGLYWVIRGPASYLLFCPADAGLSAQRGYRLWGACPDGHEPLLKPVAARPGDRVTVTVQGSFLRGTLVPDSAPSVRDSEGRTMQAYRLGEVQLGNGQWWVLSPHPQGYDSRYFGPVDDANCEHLRPLWIGKRHEF